MDSFTKYTTQAKKWRTKTDAIKAAKDIGWLAADVLRVDAMGWLVWVIADPHMNYITVEGYENFLNSTRNSGH